MSRYTVAEICFEFHADFSCAEWNAFLTGEKRPSVFQMKLLSETEEIHGLDNYKIEHEVSHIVRRGGDIMVVDKDGEMQVFYHYSRQTILQVFSAKSSTPMLCSVTSFIFTVL